MKKRTVKKVIALTMMLTTLTSMATVTSYAAKKNYSFSVSAQTGTNNGSAFSAGNYKDDSEQKAYIVTKSGNIYSGDLFYMAVYKTPIYSDSYKVTYWKRITKNNATYTIDYKNYRGKNSKNYLCADTDRYSVSVEGYWYS